MSDDARKLTREERLAIKLRENLRRRKAQARALGAPVPAQDEDPVQDENEPGRLSKSPPES